MENEILFTEKLKFTQWWLWLLLLGLNGLLIFGAFKKVIGKQQFGSKPMSDKGLIIATRLFVALTLLMISFKLKTKIKRDGIYVFSLSI